MAGNGINAFEGLMLPSLPWDLIFSLQDIMYLWKKSNLITQLYGWFYFLFLVPKQQSVNVNTKLGSVSIFVFIRVTLSECPYTSSE